MNLRHEEIDVVLESTHDHADVPSSVEFAKKSTFATVPSLSLAFAEIDTVAGAVNVAPFAGLVSDTVGG